MNDLNALPRWIPVEAYREAMTCLSAAVNVVTSDGPAGRLGFTASAVCSVSDSPPTLLVCMNRNSRQNAPVKANGVLAVNTLSAGQEHLAQVFAGQTELHGEARFGEGIWGILSTGAPILNGAVATFDCRITDVQEVATHSVFFCVVESLVVHERPSGLVYFRRVFHQIAREAR